MQVIRAIVAASAVLLVLRGGTSRAACYNECDCPICPALDDGEAIHAVPFPCDPEHPGGGYAKECKRDANPEGSESWSAEQWAGYLGLTVAEVWDTDVKNVEFWYEGPILTFQQPDCQCELRRADGPWQIYGGPLVVVWSGSVDLTTVGSYNLTATVINLPPEDDPLLPCPCDEWVADEPLDVCFTAEVYTGVWVSHEDGTLGHLTLVGPSSFDCSGATTYTPYFDWSSIMSKGDGWAYTLFSNRRQDGTYSGAAHSGSIEVTTANDSVLNKWYRWEDGKGNPSDCPVPRTPFQYRVTLRGTAKASGESYNGDYIGNGHASSQAAATATVFPWGDVAQDPQGEHTMSIHITGSLDEEPPHYNWTLSAQGVQVGGDTGSSPTYNADGAPQIVIAMGVLLPKTLNGGPTGIVRVTVTGAGYSQSSVDHHAARASAEATVTPDEFVLAPLEE